MYRTWSRFYIKKQRKLCVNLCFVNVPGIATRLHWRLHRRFEEPVGTDGRTKCHPSRLQSCRDGSELPVSRRMGSRAAHSGHRVWSRRKAVLAHHGQGTYRAVLVQGMYSVRACVCLVHSTLILIAAWCQSGFEKTRVFLKKPTGSGFFSGFLGFFGFFRVLLGFFKNDEF